MRPPRLSSPASQRGIGALVVVMSLFFIMSMVAAYASRNLIFEQKTSANNYRSTQAFEAAEAGLEWAIAMLNGGRVDGQCGTDNVVTDTFRDRHLEPVPPPKPEGYFRAKPWVNAGERQQPSCFLGKDENGKPRWICSCPSGAAPGLAEPAGTGPAPAFRITFETVDQPGLIRVFSKGCSSLGTQSECLADDGPQPDAVANVNALVALAPSLTQTPSAALTVRGRLDVNGTISVANTDTATNGITINAANLVAIPDPVLSTLPGSPTGASKAVPDRSSLDVVTAGGLTGGEMMFLAAFGMPPAVYRTLPAVVRMTCANGCAAKLQNAWAQYPRRVIWIDGDLVIDDDAPPFTIGSVASPVVVIVSGNMTFGIGSNVTINGLVYSRGARWVATGSTALVNGAFVAEGLAAGPDEGSFTITGSPAIVFDADVVAHLKKAQERRVMDFGSIVRVPGSWRDFGQ